MGVASWEERKKGRRNHITVHKLHARQWTRLIHTFFPNAHCTMFRGQWRIQIEQEASWLCVSVRSELTAIRLLSCPATQVPTLTISRNLLLSLGATTDTRVCPDQGCLTAQWESNEAGSKLFPPWAVCSQGWLQIANAEVLPRFYPHQNYRSSAGAWNANP